MKSGGRVKPILDPARISTSTDDSARSPISQIRWNSPALLLVFLIFGSYYRWTVHPHVTVEVPEHGVYNFLTDAYLQRQLSLLITPDPRLLQLNDPYDPKQNSTIDHPQDLSLYKGRYYVYYGPAAALTLFLPFRVLFGISLPDRIAVWLFGTAAFIGACLFLKTAVARFCPRTPRFIFYGLCCALGFSNVFPSVLRRPGFYETAITSGQCFLLWGLYLLLRACLDEKRSTLSLALGGASLGMAILARPSLVFGGLALVWTFLLNDGLGFKEKRRRFLIAAVPFAAALVLVSIHNYLRFDSPFDFGIRYQLAGINSSKVQFFSAGRLLGNIFLFLLYPPKISGTFPYLGLFLPSLKPASNYLWFEPIAGLLWLSPLCLELLLIPVLVIGKQNGVAKRGLLALIGGLILIGAVLLLLDASLMATMRYLADFASLFFIAAAITGLRATEMVSRPVLKRVAIGIIASLTVMAILICFPIGLVSQYDSLKNSAPGQFETLEKLAQPVGTFLRAIGVPK
jgi:hypothetical protein